MVVALITRRRRRGSGDGVTKIAALGHLTRDVVAGADPRPGGGVFYATRALARLGADAHVEASCSAEHRPALVPPLEAFGLPVDLARVVHDGRVQLPLRGRPTDHVAGRGRRPVDARAGGRGSRRRHVDRRLRADAHGLPAGHPRRARPRRPAAARRPAGSRPHRRRPGRCGPTRTSATCSGTSRS